MRSKKVIPFLTVHLCAAMKSSTDDGGGGGPKHDILSCSGENRDYNV